MSEGGAADRHPTAIVDPDARIDAGASIGPYAVLGAGVEVGAGVRIGPHAHVRGRTRLSAGVQVFPYASVGEISQDMKYAGEDTALVVGERTVIREHATLHLGTCGGGGVTRVGADCLLMVGVHVAHDCEIGDHVILSNGVGLGGHVAIQDHVVMGAMSGVHQFCHIGKHAMVGAMSAVDADLPPYCVCSGNRARLEGLNLRGLRRRGFDRSGIAALRRAYEEMFKGDGRLADRLQRLSDCLTPDELATPEVQALCAFLAVRTRNRRPLMPLARR